MEHEHKKSLIGRLVQGLPGLWIPDKKAAATGQWGGFGFQGGITFCVNVWKTVIFVDPFSECTYLPQSIGDSSFVFVFAQGCGNCSVNRKIAVILLSLPGLKQFLSLRLLVVHHAPQPTTAAIVTQHQVSNSGTLLWFPLSKGRRQSWRNKTGCETWQPGATLEVAQRPPSF